MNKPSTTFQTLISGLTLTLGLYWLKDGFSNNSWLSPVILVAGAALFALGFLTLYSVVRSVLSHRMMLRHATGAYRVHKTVSSHNHEP